MQCPAWELARCEMYIDLRQANIPNVDLLLDDTSNVYKYLMGGCHSDVNLSDMVNFWCIAAKHITAIYTNTVRGR